MSDTQTFSPQVLSNMRDDIVQRGATFVTDANGAHVVLALAPMLGIEGNRVMLAYENMGMTIFFLDRPMNAFRLVQAGFSMRVAPMLADMVNKVCGMGQGVAPKVASSGKGQALLDNITQRNARKET